MPNTLTVTEASRRIQAGQLSPLDLLRACLSRIDAIEDRVHAWVTLDREGAESQARDRQEELAQEHRRRLEG